MKQDNNNCNNIENECHNCHHEKDSIDKQQLGDCNKIAELENVIASQEKNIAYLKADIENIRRNNFKEVQQSVNRHTHKIVMGFLSVLDDYERSLDYAKKLNQQELLHGLLITYNAFNKVLADLEVKEIDCSGQFNPEFHDAISTHIDETKEPNSIFTVVQKGFLYKNQVMRPAKVIIVA